MAARDTAREAGELLIGSLRKVAIAGYHARELRRVLDDEGTDEIALQAHFEGVLYAGISAEEKLTLAVGHLTGIAADKDTKRLILRLLERDELADLGRRLRDWIGARENEKTLAEEARTLRNAATHRFYDKSGGGDQWYYQVELRPSHFLSGLVLDFSESYARHLAALEPIIEMVVERWELRLEPAVLQA